MSLIKKVGAGIIIAVSLYTATPKAINWHYSRKAEEFRRDKAYMKTIELADKNHNRFIHPTELHEVKILSGAGSDFNGYIEDLTRIQLERYLKSRGFKWNNKRKGYVKIKCNSSNILR